MNAPAIQPYEVKQMMDEGKKLLLLDVRQPMEVQAAKIEGSVNIPMGEINSRIGELSPGTTTIVHCHHGMRSAQVASILLKAGFKDVLNMAGGIDQWSLTVDAAVPRYEFDGRSVRVQPARR